MIISVFKDITRCKSSGWLGIPEQKSVGASGWDDRSVQLAGGGWFIQLFCAVCKDEEGMEALFCAIPSMNSHYRVLLGLQFSLKADEWHRSERGSAVCISQGPGPDLWSCCICREDEF